MGKLEKAIADLNEIKGKLIPAIARMYGSGISSVFACEKTEEKLDNAIELLKEQKEQGNKLDYLFSKIAGHSDYHGDSILTAITCVKEGKEIESVIPKDGEHG